MIFGTMGLNERGVPGIFGGLLPLRRFANET